MWALCTQVFAITFGIGIVTPLVGVHAYMLGGGFPSVGAAYGIFFVGRLCLTPIVGRMSDFRGRRPFLIVGFLLTSVSGLLLLSAGGVPVLVLARLLQGMAAAMIIPLLIASAGVVADPQAVASRMGLFNGLRSIGYASGFVAGVAVMSIERTYPFISYLTVTASGAIGIAVLPGLPKRATQAAVKITRSYRALFRDRLVTRLALFRASLAMTGPAIVAFLPVLIKTGGPGTKSMALVQGLRSLPVDRFVILSLIGVSAGVLQIGFGWFLDRYGRLGKTPVVAIGALAVSAVLITLPQLDGFGSLAAAAAIAGLGAGALYLPGLMLLIRAGRTRGMGTVVALVEVAASVGAVIGATLATAATSVSPEYLFQAVALFPLAALVFYIAALNAAEDEGTSSVNAQTNPHHRN